MKLGDFELNKIYCMDCLEGLKKIPDNSIDLIVTDPPYNLKKDFENDDLTEEEFINFLTPILNECSRVIKPKHSVIIFFDYGKKLPLFFKCLFNSTLNFQKGGVLYKPNDCSMPHNRTLRTSEAFFICSKTLELNHEGDSYIHDCLIQNHKRKEKWYHPTAKAKKPILDIVLSHSLKNEIVLDCFMGSGTTALACKQLNRNFIGFEISPEYCKIAEKRLAQEVLF
jgi:site-specific DNA-methyltransferase (adenine-specific)